MACWSSLGSSEDFWRIIFFSSKILMASTICSSFVVLALLIEIFDLLSSEERCKNLINQLNDLFVVKFPPHQLLKMFLKLFMLNLELQVHLDLFLLKSPLDTRKLVPITLELVEMAKINLVLDSLITVRFLRWSLRSAEDGGPSWSGTDSTSAGFGASPFPYWWWPFLSFPVESRLLV